MTLNGPGLIGLVGVLATAAALSHPLVIAGFLLMVVMPGWLLSRLLQTIPLAVEERLILSVGLGIAWIPVASKLLTLLAIPLVPATLVGVLAVMTLAAWRLRSLKTLGVTPLTVTHRPDWPQWLLLAILLVSVVTRLAPFRHLDVPFFADPALHGTITRLILDQHRIPDMWGRFAPLDLHHPTGFASIVAWLALISHHPIPSVILTLTNLLHALFPLSVYFLAAALFPNRVQALAAALFAALAAFPTATVVAGMNATVAVYLLVPLAAGVAIRLLTHGLGHTDAGRRGVVTRWPVLLGLTILLTGAMLIHPSFLVFFLLLMGPYVALFVFRRQHLKERAATVAILAVAFLCALLFTVPAVLQAPINRGLLEEQWTLQARYVNPKQTLSPWCFVEPVFFLFNNPQGAWVAYLEDATFLGVLTTQGAGLLLSGLFIFAIWLTLRDRNRLGLYLVSVYLIFLALSWVQSVYTVPFPGWQALYPSRVKFLIALPVALLLARLFATVRVEDVRLPGALLSLRMLLVGVIAPYPLWALATHLHSLALSSPMSASDQAAIHWIEQHVPNDAVILNTIKDVEAGVFIGGAGQWIPALTGRAVLFPALSLTEEVENPAIANRLTLMEELATRQVSSTRFLKRLRADGVRYVFLSPTMMRTRRTLFPPVGPEPFLASPSYRLAFQREQTYVFAVSDPHDGQ